jgi:hypothetical protein
MHSTRPLPSPRSPRTTSSTRQRSDGFFRHEGREVAGVVPVSGDLVRESGDHGFGSQADVSEAGAVESDASHDCDESPRGTREFTDGVRFASSGVESLCHEAHAAGDVAVRLSALLFDFRDVVPGFTDVVSAFPHEVRAFLHVVRECTAVVEASSNVACASGAVA